MQMSKVKSYPLIMRKNRKLLGAGIFLFITAGFIIFSINAIAQNVFSGQTLEVSPPTQEIQANPGQRVTLKTKIRNRGKETLPILVRIEDFTAQGEEGQVALIDKGSYAVSSWTTIDPERFILKPNEDQEITATIQIPSDAGGGRYGSFVFGVEAEKKGGQASITQEIASLFLMRISGEVNEQLNLLSIKTPSFSEFGPIPFELKFQNNGNIHVKTYGLINVVNMFGQRVADIIVPGTNIFPGASRLVKATLDKKFLIGNYTATAIMYYGSIKNQTITGSTSFFVFPVRLIAAIIIIIFFLYLIRKRLKKALRDLIG